MEFEFQNVVMHILGFFPYVYDCQMMPSKFKFITYYDINYTSPFLVENWFIRSVFSPIDPFFNVATR